MFPGRMLFDADKYLVLSCLVLSCLVFSCFVLPRLFSSRLVLSCPCLILWCLSLSCLLLAWLGYCLLSRLVLSCLVLSRTLSCLVLPCLGLSFLCSPSLDRPVSECKLEGWRFLGRMQFDAYKYRNRSVCSNRRTCSNPPRGNLATSCFFHHPISLWITCGILTQEIAADCWLGKLCCSKNVVTFMF